MTEASRSSAEELLAYFSRFSREQPDVSEWSDAAVLTRRWIALLENNAAMQAEVTALLDDIARREEPGSGWYDLWLRVRAWALSAGFDVGSYSRNPWAK